MSIFRVFIVLCLCWITTAKASEQKLGAIAVLEQSLEAILSPHTTTQQKQAIAAASVVTIATGHRPNYESIDFLPSERMAGRTLSISSTTSQTAAPIVNSVQAFGISTDYYATSYHKALYAVLCAAAHLLEVKIHSLTNTAATQLGTRIPHLDHWAEFLKLAELTKDHHCRARKYYDVTQKKFLDTYVKYFDKRGKDTAQRLFNKLWSASLKEAKTHDNSLTWNN